MRSGNSNDAIFKEVVIIGNGPSGLALSYMLSGNIPFLTSYAHPDEMLSMRLQPVVNQSLIHQDLGHLAAGLEGRSNNPVSLLLDSLLHPCADLGLEMPPLAEFKKIGTEVDHVVLGKGPPGGAWHQMDPYILTLSLGSWMALPGLPFHSRDSGEKRAYACNVAKYYVQYANAMNLSKYFINNENVIRIRPIAEKTKENQDNEIIERLTARLDSEKLDLYNSPSAPKTCIISNALNYILSKGQRKLTPNRCCKRPREELCQGQNPDKKIRDVNTQARPLLRENESLSFNCDLNNCDNFNNDSINFSKVPFRIKKNCDVIEKSNWVVESQNVESGEITTYHCKYLVLANGANDLPNRLEFSKYKKDPSWLFHELRGLESQLDSYLENKKTKDIDPVLVVGAGLSAADAVMAARGRNLPVIHVFRNKSADLNKQLPENMYPEYHKVHQMMKDGGSTYPYYTAYPEYTLSDVDEFSRSAILTSRTGETLKLRISFAAILIGSRPNLDFLPHTFNLGVKQELPIDCKNNNISIDKLTHKVEGFDSLYAIGPLAGDNFVRFIPGGALAVLADLYKNLTKSC